MLFQNRRLAILSCLEHNDSAAETTVFFIFRWAVEKIYKIRKGFLCAL
jgi:hypothetical protein